MAIVLNRAEFFTLATLLRADQIFGLDAGFLLPPDAEAQRALYADGRERLQQRDLMRLTSPGKVEIEHGLQELMTALIDPVSALLVVRHLPEEGRRAFLYYARQGVFVEQTLLDAQHHQLGVVGDSAALTDRLLQIFPVSAFSFVPEAFTVAATALSQAFTLVEGGQVIEARDRLERGPASDPTLAAYMADLFANALFSGTLTLVRPIPGQVAHSLDIVVVQAPDEVWGFTPTEDPEQLLAERINATVLRATFSLALSTLDHRLGGAS